MNELREEMDALDLLIEQALSDEPFLKAPVSLQRGVEARLQIAALRDHEKARFSASMMSLALVVVASLALAGLLVWFTNFSFLYSEGVSGGKGQLDYYATALAMSFTSYQGGYSLLGSLVLAIGALVVAVAMQVHKFIYMDY